MVGGQLCDQIWYWGNVDKSVVSEVMQDQPEGTFMVRDASSPGDYTLTVRFGGHTKLVRIHVYKGRCGFALESLTHDSVVSLIEFYRTRSLKIIDLDRKVKQLEDVLSTLHSCAEATDETDLKRTQAFKANCEIIEKAIKRLRDEHDLVMDRRAKVSKIIEDLIQAIAHAKGRLVSCNNTRNQSYTELFKKGVPKNQLASTIEISTSMLEKESMQASELLADIRLAWEPEQ
ncbi:SH2 domain protein [Ancylostoma ceylanicum]|uniref:SH2 domain protein n=1 Tax=Ancylostoma ceylanicum TaxID=53326 RepID=A0A0D6MCD7_9BILA|nr:SH2 domain protein [Ancylostoma ceylanicum]